MCKAAKVFFSVCLSAQELTISVSQVPVDYKHGAEKGLVSGWCAPENSPLVQGQ